MKNITLTADEQLIEQARQTAKKQHKTLNQAFREWLESYARPESGVEEYEALMKRLSYVNAGRKFTREEMNER
jgi:flagellar biosynthesis chaperone FliJ